MDIENPIGLAAGFDKNGALTSILPSIGFGFAEVGSLTGDSCAGNARPRLWRLPKSKGLVVHYGLKNDGCKAVAARLQGMSFAIPIGVSAAKTNAPTCTTVLAGIEDYARVITTCLDIGAYFTINISCPNTFGGEPFSDPKKLDQLLTRLDALETPKPFFLKMSADISFEALDAIVTIADRHRVHGFILSNLTKKRDRPELDATELRSVGPGGVSGRPVFDASKALISHLYQTTSGRYVIVGCGGVFCAEDAYDMIVHGASLIQLITGMIFEGPQLIGEINRDLVGFLRRDGFSSLAEAIGSAYR